VPLSTLCTAAADNTTRKSKGIPLNEFQTSSTFMFARVNLDTSCLDYSLQIHVISLQTTSKTHSLMLCLLSRSIIFLTFPLCRPDSCVQLETMSICWEKVESSLNFNNSYHLDPGYLPPFLEESESNNSP
jgi:hypothetical protein